VRHRLCEVANREIEEGEPLQRAHVGRRDAQRHVPLVERPLVIALVGEDAGVQVVRVGEVRVALEAGQGHPVGRLELAFPAQQLPKPEEHQAVRVLGELARERLDLVKH